MLEINDGLIDHVILYRAYLWWMRFDVLPFFFLYLILFILAINENVDFININYDIGMKWSLVGIIAIPIILTLHLFLFLLSQYSVELRCRIGHKEVQSISNAQYIHVKSSKNAGNERIVKVFRTLLSGKVTVAGKEFEVSGEYFEFQKVSYSYDKKLKTFVRLEYPTSGPCINFINSLGYQNISEISTSQQKWGKNEFDIPIPGFLDLYAEHLVAPFFVFQVLCLLLWSLDDYWYYSMFTLFMLMFFEGVLCKQRQNSLLMLRRMRRPPYSLFVLRGNKWEMQSSDELVPGDVISITIIDQTRIASRRKDNHVIDKHEDRIIPCDAFLIRGSCVVNEAMLTGESVPQLKETLRIADNRDTAILNLGVDNNVDAIWRRHLIFGGTALLQHTELLPNEEENQSKKVNNIIIPTPPDKGCVAVVVRTGYGTCQGGLMRKILFATERVNTNSMETFYFIGVLVIFAFIASGAVLHGGLQDDSRNRFKLVLHCIMIITSVVPPELPMELSLSVTNSLGALSRGLVFCTEPFRIPLAGKVNILCFDKTGTLTKDKMILKGIVGAQEVNPISMKLTSTSSSPTLAPLSDDNGGIDELPSSLVLSTIDSPLSCPNIVTCIMGSCHSLMISKNGNAIGDPLEIATLQSSGFQFGNLDGSFIVNTGLNIQLKVLHKYPFSSSLKRMSTIVQYSTVDINNDKLQLNSYNSGSISSSNSSSSPSSSLLLFTKGAPEILADRITNLPDFYKSTYLHHMNKGKRVLTIACKKLSIGMSILSPSRNDMENGLTFVGFLIFDCDLKADSKSVIKDLRSSNHKVLMITGDSAYTAADVGKRLNMLKSDEPILILQPSETNPKDIVWTSVSYPNKITKFDVSKVSKLANKNNLCVTGPALNYFNNDNNSNSILRQICSSITIFARVSPTQKENIIIALNDESNFTLMCGDGTNDVGALKAAHVGVSIVNDAEFEGRIEHAKDPSSAKKGEKKIKGQNTKDRMARAMLEIHVQDQDPTIVKLGDASIASPFTARRTSIDSVLTVIKQGRCTLVTTIQVFKILALNCLVCAYMMSALYLKGLKQGDMQMTSCGLVTAGLFLFLSQAKPLHNISSMKPPISVFSKSVVLSVFGQFITHLACLIVTLTLCEKYMVDKSDDPSMGADGKFQPNIINSAIFLLSSTMQINNFVVNYRGHPFTQSIQENTYLYRSIIGVYVSLLILCGGQFEPLNDFFQMAPFPSSDFQASLICILIANFGTSFFIEKYCRSLEK
jgi:cation-transporting ATPase 13A1